jgi:hypothetical protein
VFLLDSSVPNPILMINSFSVAMWSLTKVEKMCVGFDLGHMSNSLKEF